MKNSVKMSLMAAGALSTIFAPSVAFADPVDDDVPVVVGEGDTTDDAPTAGDDTTPTNEEPEDTTPAPNPEPSPADDQDGDSAAPTPVAPGADTASRDAGQAVVASAPMPGGLIQTAAPTAKSQSRSASAAPQAVSTLAETGADASSAGALAALCTLAGVGAMAYSVRTRTTASLSYKRGKHAF